MTGSDALFGHKGKVVAVWVEGIIKQVLFLVAWVVVHVLYLTPWYLLHFFFYLTAFTVVSMMASLHAKVRAEKSDRNLGNYM